MLKNNELEEMRRLAEIEKKLATASTNRENNLIAKSTSSAKKRVLTPRSSSPSSNTIEEKIVAAQNRREIYLTNKVEKAKNTRITPPKINKALFAAVSPKHGNENDTDTSPNVSPRIKAARLDEFHVCYVSSLFSIYVVMSNLIPPLLLHCISITSSTTIIMISGTMVFICP